MSIWMKNTDGRSDAVLTMAFVGFVVVVAKTLVSGVTLTFGPESALSFGTLDAAMAGTILTSTLGAYCARRYTEKKFENGNGNGGK